MFSELRLITFLDVLWLVKNQPLPLLLTPFAGCVSTSAREPQELTVVSHNAAGTVESGNLSSSSCSSISIVSLHYRQITRERKCWSCPNISPVTADLIQDKNLREEIKLFEQNKNKPSESVLSCTNKNETRDDKEVILPLPVYSVSKSGPKEDIKEKQYDQQADANSSFSLNAESVSSDNVVDNVVQTDEITSVTNHTEEDVNQPVSADADSVVNERCDYEDDDIQRDEPVFETTKLKIQDSEKAIQLSDETNVDVKSSNFSGLDADDSTEPSVSTYEVSGSDREPIVKESNENVQTNAFDEQTEEHLIKATINTLIGSTEIREDDKKVDIETNDDDTAVETAHTGVISSETIAFLFDDPSQNDVQQQNTQSENKSPLKIDLKLGFEKLSNKVQVHNNIVNDIDQELEVYESNVEVSLDPNQIKISSIDIPVVHDQDRNTNFVVSEEISEVNRSEDGQIGSVPPSQQISADTSEQSIGSKSSTMDMEGKEEGEVRIIKMVDEEDANAFEKLNKIKEELSKTKTVTARRKSEDDTKKPSVKPFEVKPITNALQGLQALLKMGKPQSSSSSSSTTSSTSISVSVTSTKTSVSTSSSVKTRISRSPVKNDNYTSSRKEKDDTRSRSRHDSRHSTSSDKQSRKRSSDRKSSQRRNSSSDTSRRKRSESSSSRRNKSGDRRSSRHSSRSRSRDRKSRYNEDHKSKEKKEDKYISTRKKSSPSRSPRKKSRGELKINDSKYKQTLKEINKISGNSESQPTKINRSAVIRDSKVEDDSKSLAKELISEDSKEILPKDDSKFKSSQMNSIRKTLMTDSSTQNKPRDEKIKKSPDNMTDDDEIKVLSYKDYKMKPRVDEHVRIIRKVDTSSDDSSRTNERLKRKASKSPEKSKNKFVKKVIEKERIVRKVYAVEKDEEQNIEKVTLEKSVKQTSKETLLRENRLSPSSDRKASLDLIKEELERVKNRVDNMNKTRVRTKSANEEKENESDEEMTSILKDVQQMEEEVKDISQDVEDEVKEKEKVKDKEKEKGKGKKKKKDKEKVKAEKDSRKKKKVKSTSSNDIEIDSKLAKKILSSILGSNIGKTLNDVIRNEVNKTDTAIEKLKEDLKKQKGDKGKKRKHKDKDMEDDERKSRKREKRNEKDAENKTKDDQSVSSIERKSKSRSPVKRKISKKVKSPIKRKSKKDDSHEEGKKKHKRDKERDLEDSSKSKKSKSDKKKSKKKKSKKKPIKDKGEADLSSEVEERIDNDDSESVKEAYAPVKEEEIKEERIIKELPSTPKEDFDLVIGVTDDDIQSLEKDNSDKVKDIVNEEKVGIEENTDPKDSCSNSGTVSNVATDNDDEDEDDAEVLRAKLLTQIANPRPRSRQRNKITWTPPRRQQSEDKETKETTSGPSYALPQYAYAFSRTFITHEEKQLYFPNLFSSVILEDDEDTDSDSSCDEDCDVTWDERRTTNWVTSRMSDPRFSAAMDQLLRQGRDRDSPEYYY